MARRYPLDRPLPAALSVAEAVDVYLTENGFTLEQYDADVVTVTFWGINLRVPNPPQRKLAVRFHDLHHIVTGYGTDPVGEAEISAFELRRGVGVFGWYVRGIVLVGTAVGFVHSPRRTWRAWKAAGPTPALQRPSMAHYARLLELSVGELRTLFGVEQAGTAGARVLNENAPPPQQEPGQREARS